MRHFVVVSSLLLSVAACTAEAGPHASAAPAAPVVAAKVPAGALGTVFAEAEALRTALAADSTTLAPITAKLAAATAALAAEPTKHTASDALTAAAKGLTDVTAGAVELNAVRAAYGELQKVLVGVVAADASLQPGRFLFECPMAKGYQRWIQVSPQMANPYMGKRMLECGSTLEAWKVAG
jgi:Cu(I)/Ag(I) efflux system membrane fusion protein